MLPAHHQLIEKYSPLEYRYDRVVLHENVHASLDYHNFGSAFQCTIF